MKSICKFIADYMGFLVLLFAVFAFFIPQPGKLISPFIINYLLGIIMFGMGLMLNASDFKVVFSRPKDALIGLAAQFIIMPSLAWLLTVIFGLEPAIAIGVILVGCCPGGTASNVITFLAKGDLALSVGITAMSTIVAPFLTPLLTWILAGENIQVNIMDMFVSIITVVFLPISLGLIVKRLWTNFTKKAVDYLPALSSIAIIFIVFIIISANAEKLASCGIIVMSVVILHNVLGLAIGYLVAWLFRMSSSKRKAVSIEVGMQNSGLATSLANIHFAQYPLATIPGAIFSVWHNISGAIIARIYSRQK